MIGYHISNHKTYDMSLVSQLILTLHRSLSRMANSRSYPRHLVKLRERKKR